MPEPSPAALCGQPSALSPWLPPVCRRSKHQVAISMDGRGRFLDNIFIERWWRSVKYEDIYLRAYDTPLALHEGLRNYFGFYNGRRRHASLPGRQTPDEAYFGAARSREAA